MSGLKEIKSRIASVKTTLKTTSAMKMVASAKLHKVQILIGNKLPYEQELRHILAGLLQSDSLREALKTELKMGGKSAVMLQDVDIDHLPSKNETDRVAIVVFSSNASLCGAFNANIVREFNKMLASLQQRGYSDSDIDIYAVGRKIADAARKNGFTLKRDCSDMADKPTYEASSDLATELIDSFTDGNVGQVILLYSHFASAASQPVLHENYLPLALHGISAPTHYAHSLAAGKEIPGQARNDVRSARNDAGGFEDRMGGGYGDTKVGAFPVDYTLEPDPLTLVKALLPKVLLLKMYTTLLDANAAENAARTMAMQIATDNAEKLISELTLAYNKGRQQEITAEILDLVGGTMA